MNSPQSEVVPEAAEQCVYDIDARGLSKVYSSSSGPVVALTDLSITVERGSFVSLLGPSGCGKSTFLMLAAGLISKSGGSLMVNGQEVTKPYVEAGVVFQEPVLLEWRTALGNVMLQAEARKQSKGAAQRAAMDLLESVGLREFARRYPYELSGGMRQRVSICRALLHEPPLLLMDEPFGALDALTREQMSLDLLRLCAKRQISVLFVTHSIDEAVFLSDKVVVMTPRPGTVDHIVDIDLPRPRSLQMRATQEYQSYVREIQQSFVARGVLNEGE